MNLPRIILSASLLALSSTARAQGMFGFMGGASCIVGYKGIVTPTLEGYYLGKVSQHLYAGGSVSFQRYSLMRDLDTDPAVAGYWDPISIRWKAIFFYLCGKADIGIGYRNRYHVHLAAGPGFYVDGEQLTRQRVPSGSPWGNGEILEVSTNSNVRKMIARVTMGISERIPTHGYWNFMLSQEFTWLPGSLTKSGTPINANYVAFTIGIMHKYPHVRVQHEEK